MGVQVFLSYRRDGGDILARMLYDKLSDSGYSVFMDVESLHSGKFNNQILSQIEDCEDFVVVLSKGALDRAISDPDDWVRHEISHAISRKKNIVPVLVEGFTFPENLPEDIKELALHNGVIISPIYTDAAMERLKTHLSSQPHKAISSTKKTLTILAVIFLILAMITAGTMISINKLSPNGCTEQEYTGEILIGGVTVPEETTALFLYTNEIDIHDGSQKLTLGNSDSNKEYYFNSASVDYLYIEITEEHFDSVEQISRLKNLTHLTILGIECDDWSFVAGLDSLIVLSMEYNRIDDISFVTSMDSLCSLNFSNNLVSDISPLKELVNLQELGAAYNQISDISAIARLELIYCLDISGNLIDDISTLSAMPLLRTLSLYSNKIEDISPLRNCIYLKFLSAQENQIEDISVLSSLRFLEFVDLGFNQISDITPLQACKAIQHLSLGGNQITDISALKSIIGLVYLDLSMNNIGDISALEGLTFLETVDLSFNEITDFSALSGTLSLYELTLYDLVVYDIAPLMQLENLRILFVTIGDPLWDGEQLYTITPEQFEALTEALPECYIGPYA